MSLDDLILTRRQVLAALVLALTGFASRPALAKGDDDNSGSGKDDKDDNDKDDKDDKDDDDKDDDDKDDDDKDDKKKDVSTQIRAAVKRGEAASLREILAIVRRKYPGQVVGVRLIGSGSKLSYRIRVIDRSNRLIEVSVSARTKTILSVRGV